MIAGILIGVVSTSVFWLGFIYIVSRKKDDITDKYQKNHAEVICLLERRANSAEDLNRILIENRVQS